MYEAPLAGTAPTSVLDFQTVFDQIVAWDPAFAGFAPTVPPASGDDFVAGSQQRTDSLGDYQHIRVSAHSGPNGEEPTGSVEVTLSFTTGVNVDVKADVTCLFVGSNFAQVAALLREPAPPPFEGATHVILILIDNGEPGELMGQSPDIAAWNFISNPPPKFCATFAFSIGGEASGNIVVHDSM
jgi:hypothetical protein